MFRWSRVLKTRNRNLAFWSTNVQNFKKNEIEKFVSLLSRTNMKIRLSWLSVLRETKLNNNMVKVDKRTAETKIKLAKRHKMSLDVENKKKKRKRTKIRMKTVLEMVITCWRKLFQIYYIFVTTFGATSSLLLL